MSDPNLPPERTLTLTIPHRGWRRSPKAEASYAKEGVKATAYVVDSQTSDEIRPGISLVVSVIEGFPQPHATIGILDENPKALPDEVAVVCWERAQKCAPAGDDPGGVCSRKGCAHAARWVPILVVAAKIRPNATARGRLTNLVLCEAHKATTTVDDLVTDLGWNAILAKFMAKGLAKPHRSLTRVEFEELV